MNINHISVSRKKCFDQCAQLYKYRYHLKTPAPGPEPFYFVYGNIVHKIAEVYVKEKTKRSIGDVALDVLNGKIMLKEGQVCPPLEETYRKKLQTHLKAIQNLTSRIGSDGMIEYEFKYDLDPPHKRCVTGFIDRLIIKGEGESTKAFIIEYKTTKKGKFRVNNKTVLEDLQLRCYARFVQREFNISPANIKVALCYLEGENIVAAQYNNESLERVEKELKDGFINIENSNPDLVWGKVGWHCKNCDYSKICQFYKPKSKWNGNLIELGYNETWN